MSLGLADDTLLFEFPEIHESAVLEVAFHRTLRVPDDGRRYNLPPGLGRFPLQAVDDLRATQCPPTWRRRGGIVLPMWQAEACWISFRSRFDVPFAVKVAAGKVNALTGAPWSDEFDFAAADYMEVPGQPWLDGFCAAKGVVRQFVAMPLGAGYTAEEQITGKAEHGGIQILARPMRREVWWGRLFAAQAREREELLARHRAELEDLDRLHAAGRVRRHQYAGWAGMDDAAAMPALSAMRMSEPVASDMGLGAGGRIRQEVHRPVEKPEVWDPSLRSRCFIHLADASGWRALTHHAPPTKAPTAKDYARSGLPWFDYYDADATPREGSTILAALKSVFTTGEQRGEQPLPENEGFEPPEPVVLRPRRQRFGTLSES